MRFATDGQCEYLIEQDKPLYPIQTAPAGLMAHLGGTMCKFDTTAQLYRQELAGAAAIILAAYSRNDAQ